MNIIINLFKNISSSPIICGYAMDTTISNEDVAGLTNSPSALSSILQILGLLVLFILIIVAAIFATKWLSKVTQGSFSAKNISIVETFKISPTKYIQIICVAKKYFAIAVSKEDVTLLGELERDNIDFESANKELISFKDMLDELSAKRNKENKNEHNKSED